MPGTALPVTAIKYVLPASHHGAVKRNLGVIRKNSQKCPERKMGTNSLQRHSTAQHQVILCTQQNTQLRLLSIVNTDAP